ncbi:MAG: JAB domain-containing protein [Gammaproteobacteria bacterium]|nr:MAG: JAB domain-containing protein [Gammaproteobacteria bacterium]
MSIKDWPDQERPREKLLHRGSSSLSDAELLAIFLRTGMKGRSAVDLARDMIKQFGSLRAVLSAPRETFCALPGIGDTKYAQLQAALEIGRRYLFEEIRRGEAINSPQTTRDYLNLKLRHLPHEVFACLFMDNRHQVIEFDEMFRGTLDGASVYPREVVKRAIQLDAKAVIFAHNHPSGMAEPSEADLALTRRLKDALALVEIRVLDHFVIGDGEAVSFAERGLL